VLESFIKSDAFETIPQYAVSVLANHLNQHEAMVQNMQQMQTQQMPMPSMGAPEPGEPVEGMASPGGEMSMMQGGPK
jgi:hypothetical protein